MESPKYRVKSAVTRMRDDGVLKVQVRYSTGTGTRVHAFPSWFSYSPAMICDFDQTCLINSPTVLVLVPRSLDLRDPEHAE